MKLLTLLSFFGLICSISCFAKETQPLKINNAEGWKIEYKGDGLQFYSLSHKDSGFALLMFSRWAAPADKEQIPILIKQISEAFLREAEKKKLTLLKKESRSEKIEGEQFSGEAAVFALKGGLHQTIFMVGDSEGIWNGQFTGSKEHWEKAKIILSKLQKR